MWANQHVMITGATGFVGGALARRLLDEGAQVTAFVRSPTKAGWLRDRGAAIIEGDIAEPAAAALAVKDCRIVFHIAAATGGAYPNQVWTNVTGTRTIAQAAADAGCERFVHMSTLSVYGNCQRGDVTEDRPLAPGAAPYGQTKAAAERALIEIAQRTGLAYSIIRPGMIYGPRSPMWTRNLFRLARLRPTPFIGDGNGFAPAIFIDDVIDLTLTLALHPAASGEAFNASSDPAPTWRQLLGAYARLAGHDDWLALPVELAYLLAGLALLFSPPRSIGRDLPDMVSFIQRRSTFKMDKARRLLGWQPQIELGEGVARCAPWLREQGLLA
ncbi:MAG: NAD(P)-dependent oxidoreductase [Aggregatilineales bacterium]